MVEEKFLFEEDDDMGTLSTEGEVGTEGDFEEIGLEGDEIPGDVDPSVDMNEEDLDVETGE